MAMADDLAVVNAQLNSANSSLTQAAALWANTEQDKRNFNYQVETNDKNEALLREAWARDDSAVQRRVADLKASGLSPLLAAGSAAGNTSPIQLDAPQRKYKFEGVDIAQQLSALATVQAIKKNQEEIRGMKIANENARKQGEILDLDISNYGLPWQAQIVNRLIEAFSGKSIFEIVNSPSYNIGDLVHDIGVGVENITGSGEAAKSTPLPFDSNVAALAVQKGYAYVGSDNQIYFKSGVDWQNFFIKELGGTTAEWYYGIRKYKSAESFVRSLM